MPPPSRLEKLSPLALRKGGETRRGGGEGENFVPWNRINIKIAKFPALRGKRYRLSIRTHTDRYINFQTVLENKRRGGKREEEEERIVSVEIEEGGRREGAPSSSSPCLIKTISN